MSVLFKGGLRNSDRHCARRGRESRVMSHFEGGFLREGNRGHQGWACMAAMNCDSVECMSVRLRAFPAFPGLLS
jgi:hypothetical protein